MFSFFELELHIPETERCFRLGDIRGAMAGSPELRIGGLLIQSLAGLFLEGRVLFSRCEASIWQALNANDLQTLCGRVSMATYRRFKRHRTILSINLDCDAKAFVISSNLATVT